MTYPQKQHFRPATLVIVPFLSLLVTHTWAVDAMPPAPEVVARADERAAADSAAETGRKALRAYREDQAGNPQAVIDAALAFADAHKRFTALGDVDAVAEMQANIYWCKKQMNLDTVKEYLAHTGKSAALVQVDAVAEKPVDATEGHAYIERAKKFAGDHPQDFADISIRYFEVATRFVGTPVGVEAQQLSLEAQSRYLRKIQDGGVLRETLFTRPNAVANGGKCVIPAEREVQNALATLKTIYAKDYAGKSEWQKRSFAAKLLHEATRSKDDTTIYYSLLSEATRLAQESEDYATLLDAVDVLAGTFEALDGNSEKKLWLRKISGKPTAAAIATLLDKPADPTANTIAGKFFCFQLKRWKQGLPMLALGNDPACKAVADQELSNPAEDGQRMQVGNAWFAIAKKSVSAGERNAGLQRAQYWYQQIPASAGIADESRRQHLLEIEKALPLDLETLDWKSLSPIQWEKLQGQSGVVQVRVDRSGPIVALKPGARVRVVPHPTDTWVCKGWNGKATTTWAGIQPSSQGSSVAFGVLPSVRFKFGELLCQVGKGELQSCGIVSGPGPLWLVPNRCAGENSGEIRFKLVAVDDGN